MKSLPLLISVPHAGLSIPKEVEKLSILTREDIHKDSDGGAGTIYNQLKGHVAAFVTTSIARAFVDLNRACDDMRKDGVIKTHTCWDVPVYSSSLPEPVVKKLIKKYYTPYHKQLDHHSKDKNIILGVDCHTMAETGPPVGPDPFLKRPFINLGDLDHTSCPKNWTDKLFECFSLQFGDNIQVNKPFKGGWITRRHSKTMPWIQLEISREPFCSDPDKGKKVLKALNMWANAMQKQ